MWVAKEGACSSHPLLLSGLSSSLGTSTDGVCYPWILYVWLIPFLSNMYLSTRDKRASQSVPFLLVSCELGGGWDVPKAHPRRRKVTPSLMGSREQS